MEGRPGFSTDGLSGSVKYLFTKHWQHQRPISGSGVKYCSRGAFELEGFNGPLTVKWPVLVKPSKRCSPYLLVLLR